MNWSDVDSPNFWDEMYKEGRTAWDIGSTTPAIKHHFESLFPSKYTSVLVLGCGKGYDAVAIAKRGFEVTAIDFSIHAITLASKLAADENVTLTFWQKNLFDLSPTYDESFDMVVEYVTYCAINPLRRSEFSSNISRLIKPNGKFVGLFFPLDDRVGGPPFAVDFDEVVQLFGKYLVLEESYAPERSIEPRRGKEKMTVWTRERLS